MDYSELNLHEKSRLVRIAVKYGLATDDGDEISSAESCAKEMFDAACVVIEARKNDTSRS